MRFGGTPNLASTPASSSRSLLIVLTSVICGETSCAMSLSPVEITTRWPAASAWRAKVPITSSASTPSMQIKGQPSARTTSCRRGIWPASSSGIGGRLAL